jgi:hypothetical protein|tara:strand:- start:731 stop:949 length:219 start_codon:yes stop_codon:yes gene_type:complete
MLQDHLPPRSAFQPEDLELLQRVFENACARRGIVGEAPQAAELAAMLIDLFQCGIRGEKQLLTMLSGLKSFP